MVAGVTPQCKVVLLHCRWCQDALAAANRSTSLPNRAESLMPPPESLPPPREREDPIAADPRALPAEIFAAAGRGSRKEGVSHR